MLDIVTGLPHSDLEQALVQRIQQNKTQDPFAPLLILVPSEFQRNRLVWRLCVEYDQPLLNVQVLTFFQLARRLVQEDRRDVTVNLLPDFVFKECIHRLLRQHPAAMPTLMPFREIPGAWAALWATIKDLKDGTVDPDVALEAISQSEFAGRPNLVSVFRLYKLLLEKKQEFQWYDADDMAGLAGEAIASSPFLESQAHILYYGFYDLTQVQLDVFTRIAQHYPTTVFFPLIPRHPAFRFAQQFFDQHVCGLLSGPAAKDQTRAKGFPLRGLFVNEADGKDVLIDLTGPECRIVEVSGVDDEIGFVAKTIQRQVEDHQISFHDIGVVGRTLSGYTHILARVFAEHGIPLYSAMSRSFAEEPLIKLVIQLLGLRVSNFQREHVLDVISSPLFHLMAAGSAGQDMQADQWEAITRKLGIQKGIDQWERLQSCLENADLNYRESLKNVGVSSTQIAALWEIVSDLYAVLQTFPDQASLEAYHAHVQRVISRFIKPFKRADQQISVSSTSVPGQSERGQRAVVDDQEIVDALRQRLHELRELSPLCGEVPYSEFVSMLKRLLEESKESLKENSPKGDGVWVLDAMEARGLSFRMLFVIGLTEKVFPRHIREDAFLRDDVRRWCNESLGYKVPENLAGYDEEKLLFYLLVNSVSEFLILLYQRSDQSGHQQIPSAYLNDVQRCLGSVSPLIVPRKLSQKCTALAQYETSRLTPREYRIVWLLNRFRPTAGWKEDYAIGGLLEQGLTSLQSQEHHRDRLGPCDGITGPLPGFWIILQEKGLSPTALETYARCPFQYFARQVLGLEPLGTPDGKYGLESLEAGNLAHEVLTDCFRALKDQGYFDTQPRKALDLRAFVTQIAAPIFERYTRYHAIGYPVLWDIQQQALADLLGRVVQEDIAELGEEWMPVMFEESLKGTLSVRLTEGPQQLPITGRVDRIDWSLTQRVYRVIDYKYSDTASRKLSASGLLLDVVRGSRLQPPFYLRLAEASVRERLGDVCGAEPSGPVNCDRVWFYRISPNASPNASPNGESLTRVSFPGNAWESPLKATLENMINGFVDGIHRGHFFMTPGAQCAWCEYDMACHRTHQLSAWRARADQALISPHRRLRTQKPPCKG